MLLADTLALMLFIAVLLLAAFWLAYHRSGKNTGDTNQGNTAGSGTEPRNTQTASCASRDGADGFAPGESGGDCGGGGD